MFQSYVRYSQWIVAGYTSATHRWQAGKFPTLVQHSDNLETKVTEVRSQVPRLVVTGGWWAMLVAIGREKMGKFDRIPRTSTWPM